MYRKTKIICTLGPSTDDERVLKKLMQEGMNVARFNFSHQSHEEHKKRLETVMRLREELDLPIATLLDTKGPEIRIKSFKNNKITLKKGDIFTLHTKDIEGDENGVSITYKDLPNDIKIGNHILIDDGLCDLEVTYKTKTEIKCKVQNGGEISNSKSINVPDSSLSLPFISEKDRKDIEFGIKMGFDFLATSFTRSAQDIKDVREVLSEYDCHSMKIIAKIENREGVENIDEILKLVDGIMVARGDMGVEIPYEELPHIQKMLIKKTYRTGKQVITATQMLDSMIIHPRPTRAEASDVANAIYDGTSAIMLSGETAAGMWPIEACRAMVKIAEETEENIHYKKRFATRELNEEEYPIKSMTQAIAKATVTTAYELDASAIITVSMSGNTAKAVSRYRPNAPIIGGTIDKQVCRQMNMSWGVYPILLGTKDKANDLFDHALNKAVEKKYLNNGDVVVITAGVPLGISGTTNMIKVQAVGQVIASGKSISGLGVSSKVCVAQSEQDAINNFEKGDILVIKETSNKLLGIIRESSGLITEAAGTNSHGAIAGLTLNIPVIVGAKNITKILKSGMRIKMDGQTGEISNE